MGLDMYLHAERDFGAASPEAADVLGALAACGGPKALADAIEEHGVYVGGWDFYSDEERALYASVLAAAGLTGQQTASSPGATVMVKPGGSVTVRSTCAYWRKANAIHDWFVQNVQGGEDECRPHEVPWEQLAHLRDIATKAVAAYEAGDKEGAAGLLGPTEGFFFGSTDVDDYYADGLRDTIAQIDHALSNAIPGLRFVYQSSW